MRAIRGVLCAVLLVALGCGDDDDDGGAGQPDAANGADASAGNGADAGSADAGPTDAATPDATPTATLTVVVGEGGRVTGAGLDCGPGDEGTCTVDVDVGSELELTATPDTDFAFEAWFDACAGGDVTHSIAVTVDLTCTASFLGAAGDVAVIPVPVSVIPHETEDDDAILLFVERADLTLGASLPVDVIAPSTYERASGVVAEIPAGTRVSLYYLHFDPVGTTNSVQTIATLSLPRPLIGLASRTPTLESGDALVGRDDVTYPVAGTHPERQIEDDTAVSRDVFTLGGDRRTIDLDLVTSTSADQMRFVALAPGESLPMLASTAIAQPATPPADVTAQQTEDDALAVMFEEATVTLADALAIDIATPGRYDAPATAPGTIAAGTAVTSYLIHFDPVGAAAARTMRGQILFDRPVAGVIVGSASLDATDGLLGAAAVTYPASGAEPDRGVDAPDFVELSSDGRSVFFSLEASNAQDQLRILLTDS